MLNATQIAFYREHGYLRVDGVYTAKAIDEIRRVTDEFVERSRKVAEHDDVFDLEPGHTSASPRSEVHPSPKLS